MSAVECAEALVGLLGDAKALIRCRRIGTGGNYGVYDDCGTCPECEWREAVIAAVPSLAPDPDLDILILQRRAWNRYEQARHEDRMVEAQLACQRLGRKASAEARHLYAAKYLNTTT